MLVYPTPLLLGNGTVAVFGGTSAGSPVMAQAFCALPGSGWDCRQPGQNYSRPQPNPELYPAYVQTFGASVCESGEWPQAFPCSEPGSQNKNSHKRRRHRGGHRSKGTAPTQGHVGYPKNDASQATSAPGQSSNTGEKQALPKAKKGDASAEAQDKSGGSRAFDVSQLGNDAKSCNDVIAQLDAQGPAGRAAFMSILPLTKKLAMTKHGCRVVQHAVKMGNACDHVKIVQELTGSIEALYKDLHGNHVVAKLIEVLRPASVSFLLDELKGSMVDVARHQFGCRLLERLLEHCPAEQVEGVAQELLLDPEPLCRHPFGNFVMQHCFEHGTQAWKAQIAKQMCGAATLGCTMCKEEWSAGKQSNHLTHLAKHRTASHVVQRALEHGGEDIQRTLILALEDSLVEVGCSRYGSFVVEQVASTLDEARKDPQSTTPEFLEFCQHVDSLMQEALPCLAEDEYGKRIASKFGTGPLAKRVTSASTTASSTA